MLIVCFLEHRNVICSVRGGNMQLFNKPFNQRVIHTKSHSKLSVNILISDHIYDFLFSLTRSTLVKKHNFIGTPKI